MRSRTKLEKWVKLAKSDGWTEAPYTGVYSGKKPKGSSNSGWPKKVIVLQKNGFEARAWFGPSNESSTLLIRVPNTNGLNVDESEQSKGYNFNLLVQAADKCPDCRQTKKLIYFGLKLRCAQCVQKVKDLIKESPVPESEPRQSAGTATVQINCKHGKKNKNKVVKYTVNVRVESKVSSHGWSPYSGPSKILATETSLAVSFTLSHLDFDVKNESVHLDFSGNVIEDKSKNEKK